MSEFHHNLDDLAFLILVGFVALGFISYRILQTLDRIKELLNQKK